MATEEHGAGVLEKYRTSVYGEERSDFDTCLVALNVQADKIAMVHRALDGMSEEVRSNRHAQVLMAAHETTGEALEAINAALAVLSDCEVA